MLEPGIGYIVRVLFSSRQIRGQAFARSTLSEVAALARSLPSRGGKVSTDDVSDTVDEAAVEERYISKSSNPNTTNPIIIPLIIHMHRIYMHAHLRGRGPTPAYIYIHIYSIHSYIFHTYIYSYICMEY